MNSTIQGRREGDARARLGMELASLKKERAIKMAQTAMLNAAMDRPERTCTSDDISGDLASEYDDGGKWVGAAVRGLALARVIEKTGHAVSARPSRHANEVKLCRVRDDANAAMYMQALRLWLQRNPLPEPAITNSLFPDLEQSQKNTPSLRWA